MEAFVNKRSTVFLTHCGVFNVVVPLGRSHEMSLLPEYIITPNTGTYLVPPGEKRMELLPPGLVNFFWLIADKVEVSFFESPKKLVERNYIKPDPNVKEVIGHNAALDEDIEQKVQSLGYHYSYRTQKHYHIYQQCSKLNSQTIVSV